MTGSDLGTGLLSHASLKAKTISGKCDSGPVPFVTVFCYQSTLFFPQKNSATVPGPVWAPTVAPIGKS